MGKLKSNQISFTQVTGITSDELWSILFEVLKLGVMFLVGILDKRDVPEESRVRYEKEWTFVVGGNLTIVKLTLICNKGKCHFKPVILYNGLYVTNWFAFVWNCIKAVKKQDKQK